VRWHCEIHDGRQATISPNVRLGFPRPVEKAYAAAGEAHAKMSPFAMSRPSHIVVDELL